LPPLVTLQHPEFSQVSSHVSQVLVLMQSFMPESQLVMHHSYV